MKIASLFSGVGGLELGLEAAGLGETVAQVECDPYCQRVLARHWPSARRFSDVKQVSAADLGGAQLYCGGFPCQDVSRLGGGRGLDGERSGLWREYARLVGEGRPEWIVVENVAALVRNGLAVVLGDLAALGYDAWWDCIPAAAVGAPHLRDRLFVVARLAYAHRDVLVEQRRGISSRAVGREEDSKGKLPTNGGRGRAGAPRRQDQLGLAGLPARFPARPYEGQLAWEPPRSAEGQVLFRQRHRAIGNAVVPQVAYVVGCAIKECLR